MKNNTTKGILLIILFASMYLQSMSQNYCITNQFNFGGNENDAPVSIIKVADGYVVSGFTNSHNGSFNVPHNHDVDGFIAKFDFNNNLIWQHTYGGKGYDDLFSIKSTDDGGFIATGQTASDDGDVSGNHGGKYDTWVVKFNSLGILQWQHCYGGKGEDYPYEIHIVPGGYQVVGGTGSDNDGDVPANHGGEDAWLLTISSTGNVISSYCYGGSGDDGMSGISRNANGTSTFNAGTASNDGQVSGNHGGLSDIWLVNIDNNNGNIIWQKCIGGSAYENPHTIARTANGSIVLSIAGNSTDGDFTGSTAGCADGYAAKLVKLNPETGDIIWNKNYPDPNRCTGSFGLLVTADGGILSMGIIRDKPLESSWDGYVFKVDDNGNMLWNKSLGGSKSDNTTHWLTGIEINDQFLIPFASKSNDGDILNSLGGIDGWMVTLGPGGCSQRLATGTESNLSSEVAIFPNPVTNTATISFSLNRSENVSLRIFDVNGRLVITLADKMFEAGKNEIVWNAEDLDPGIYLLRLVTASYSENQKLIVSKSSR